MNTLALALTELDNRLVMPRLHDPETDARLEPTSSSVALSTSDFDAEADKDKLLS